MKIRLLSTLTFLLMVLFWVGLGSGQILPGNRADSSKSAPQKIKTKANTEAADRAQRLMRFGEYEKAADYLEILFEQDPHDVQIKNLLATCYEYTKNYSKMLLFLKKRLATEPPGYPLYRAVGRAYVLMGFPDSAAGFFYAAVDRVPENDRAYSSIAEIYHKFGHYKHEREFIDSARVMTGNPRLLADRMGDALAAQRNYAGATLEYLDYMEKDTLAAKIAGQRLEMLMEYPESADTVMSILSQRIKSSNPDRRLLSTYGRLLMEQGRFEDAFAFFKSMDVSNRGQGGGIVYFMRECNERGRFKYTIRAGDYLFRIKPQTTLKNSALFAMADAYIATGAYRKALESLESISDDNLRPAHRAEAMVKIGVLYKDHLNSPDRAREHLEGVMAGFPGGKFDIEARLALADLAVKEGRTDEALSLYENLRKRELPEDLMEAIEFRQAEVYLFRDEYKEAVGRFRQIISRYPRGLYVNDAIQYSLIIDEAQEEAPDQIDLFSSAEYYRYLGLDDSLEYYLNRICRVGIPSLAPVSYLNLAELYYRQNRYDESIAAIDSLATLYPESYYFPYGLKLKADILFEYENGREQAMALYRELLEDYRTYPFAAEIRQIIRKEKPASQI